MDVRLIVNPASRGGAVGRDWAQLEQRLRRHLQFTVAYTERGGHGAALAQQAAAQGATHVVAVGGDGTIHEVVNGLIASGSNAAARPCLGIIPLGTGGDLRRTLALPTDPEAAAQVIANGQTRHLDVGWIEYTGHDGSSRQCAFANVASFGVSGIVDRLVNASGKRLGRLSFALATARAAWSYQNQRVTLAVDDEAEHAATINTVAVCNGRFFGGAMQIAPDADPSDGALDLIVLGDLSLSEVLMQGPRIYAGTHLSLAKVSHRRGRVLAAAPVDASARVELDIDGENLGRLPARFSLLPSALRVMVPA